MIRQKNLPITKFMMILAFLAATAVANTPAKNCSITLVATDETLNSIPKNGLDFEGYEVLCERLNKLGLGLVISSDSGVLQDRAYGWADVRVIVKATRVRSAEFASSTNISMNADSPGARNSMVRSINKAMGVIAANTDDYITSVFAEQNRLRAALAK